MAPATQIRTPTKVPNTTVGDKANLKAAEVLSNQQHQQKLLWYHGIELIIGIIFYAPNFQHWKHGNVLGYYQVLFFWAGGSFIIHALSNILVIIYNSLTGADSTVLAVLSKAQEKLLGFPRRSASPATPPKSPSKQVHNCSLFSPVLPTIDKPLIDERLANSPAAASPGRRDGTASPSTPQNRSMLSQSTLDLLRWSKPNTLVHEQSSFVMENSRINDMLNSSSWHVNDSDGEDEGQKSKTSVHPDLSFYTNRSFLNSFDEKTSDTHTGKPKIDAWTAGTSFQIVDKEVIKKTIAEQIYRVCTPPTSPQRLLTATQSTQKQATEADPKNAAKILTNKFPLTNKFENTERLKLWLNHNIFSPLSREIAEINAIFKEKGLKQLEQMSFEHLSAVMSMDAGMGVGDAVLPIGRVDGGDKGMELAHHRTNLEPYKAKLLRMMPYLEISQKTATPLEAVIKRINDLATHAYLSSYNNETDGDIITNCLTEFFNSRGNNDLHAASIKSKNWFSNRYVTGNLLIGRETWVQHLGKLEDSTIKNLLQTMWTQKRANDKRAAGLDLDRSLDESSGNLDKVVSANNHHQITDEVAPFLIKLKSSLLLVQDSKQMHEFTGNQAVFQTWLAFIQLVRQAGSDKKLAAILPV